MLKNFPFTRHATAHVLLRLSLICGAVFNATLGVLLVLAPEQLAQWLALALPDGLFLWLFSLTLFLLAGFYVLPAYDYIAYSGNIAVAILGRLAAGGLLLWVAWERPDSNALLSLGVLEIGLAVVHAGLWLPGRRGPLL